LNFKGTDNVVVEERPLDALLAAYAARTLSAPLTALVAAHLELKLDNRAYVAALEAAHGVFLEELEPIPLVGRDRRLVNIFATPDQDPDEPAPASPPRADDTVLPRALRRFIGCDYADLRWRTALPDIKEAVVAQDEFGVTSLVSGRPGKQLPLRTQDHLKVMLVLAGSFVDADGHHERGDIAFTDADSERPLVDSESDCVCFIVSGGRAKPSGPLGRIWQRMIGG
jgi:putative transcriptional regulator